MAHPAQRYVRFLLAKAWNSEGETLVSLNRTLTTLRLPSLTEAHYGQIVENFVPPPGFDFVAHDHAATRAFMKQQQLMTIWIPEKADDQAVFDDFLGHPRVREVVDVLLMGRVPPDVIAAKTNEILGRTKPITSRMVCTYRHFFWDPDVADEAEWSQLLGTDPRCDVLMAALQGGPLQALYRVGANPKLPEPRAALKQIYRQTFFDLDALRHWPLSRGTVDLRTRLLKQFLDLHQALYADDMIDVAERLKQFGQQVTLAHAKEHRLCSDDIVKAGGSISGYGEGEGNEDGDEGDRRTRTP